MFRKKDVVTTPEYIEKHKLLRDMHSVHTLPIYHKTDEDYMFARMVGIVGEQPTADVVAVKHGEWVWRELYGSVWSTLVCSECLESDGARTNLPYCPNCGAKMDKRNGR